MPPSTLTPHAHFNGTASFSYSIQDTLGNTVATVAAQALAALDAGMGLQELGTIAMAALQQQQGHSFTEPELVQWLWSHGTGSAGSAAQLAPYVQALQEGHSTVGDLVYAAVQHAQLQPQQALAGVLQNGLLYSSDWG